MSESVRGGSEGVVSLANLRDDETLSKLEGVHVLLEALVHKQGFL